MNLLKRFYIYQEERFPIKLLIFTTTAVVLSSAAILSYHVNALQLIVTFLGCMFFLFHTRVIDESRDYQHDLRFHPDRPVQRGLISLKQLAIIDSVGMIIFIIIILAYCQSTLIYGLSLLLFSFIAWKDFFIKQWLKKRFYLYNAVNMLQMVLLQLFIYSVFTCNYRVTQVMWIHLLFVIFNTVILEIVRKINTASAESGGKDTYSYHMGFIHSLIVLLVFSLANFITFIWMLYTISPTYNWYQVVALFFFIVLVIAIYFHIIRKKEKTKQILLICTVLNYVGLNMLIYIFNI